MAKKIAEKKRKSKLEVIDSVVDIKKNKKRLTIDIPVSLHTRLKITAVKRGETMAEIICTILEEKLDKP